MSGDDPRDLFVLIAPRQTHRHTLRVPRCKQTTNNRPGGPQFHKKNLQIGKIIFLHSYFEFLLLYGHPCDDGFIFRNRRYKSVSLIDVYFPPSKIIFTLYIENSHTTNLRPVWQNIYIRVRTITIKNLVLFQTINKFQRFEDKTRRSCKFLAVMSCTRNHLDFTV